MKTAHLSAIEALEARIAPAAVVNVFDVDGDLVTITASKGTDAQLSAVVSKSFPADAVIGGVRIDSINLANDPVFAGANLTIMAEPGPQGGDGLVGIVAINATNMNLGKLTVDGDLQDLNAGKGTPDSKIKAIKVYSTSGTSIWDLKCNVDVLNVTHDLRGAEIRLNAPDARLGLLKVGGSIIGETSIRTGNVNVPDGTIEKVIIKGDILGGRGESSGVLTAKNITSVKLLGSVVGGTDPNKPGAGQIAATEFLGTVFVKGSVVGGLGDDSGMVRSDGDIGQLTVGGSVLGGQNSDAGGIEALGSIGPVKVRHNVVGGDSIGTGNIFAMGSIASVTIGGDLIGAEGTNCGKVTTQDGDIGSVKIRGSMIGDSGSGSGSINSGGKLGNVMIAGDVIGGKSAGGGSVFAHSTVGAVKIGGNLATAGLVPSQITGSPIAGVTQLAIKSITVGGRVENAAIFSNGDDAQIGPIKVGGDWIASTVATAIDWGADMKVGTNDDSALPGGNPALFTKIASITIGGQVLGTADNASDHDAFVSQEIGAMKVHGVKIPLIAGHGNDTNANDTHFILGPTRDVTVHEVA